MFVSLSVLLSNPLNVGDDPDPGSDYDPYRPDFSGLSRTKEQFIHFGELHSLTDCTVFYMFFLSLITWFH